MIRANRMICDVIVVAAVLFGVAVAAQAQSATPLEGVLHIVWGDPQPGSGGDSAIFYTLQLRDGSLVLLDMTGVGAEAHHYFQKRVIVSGRAMSGQFATPQGPAAMSFAVDSIAPAPPSADAEPGAAPALGTRKVIFLLLRFSDDGTVQNPLVPHAPSFFTDMTNPDTPPLGAQFPSTINGFFKKTSWNQFSWQADVGGVGGVNGNVTGWLTLPHPKSYYANCGWTMACANLTAIGDDGTALGRTQGINFTNYNNINFVLSNDLDCCAWGGSYFSNVDNQSYGATWEPPWGQIVPTYSHEMGHSLGLPHSGWVYFAYDSPWDTMSEDPQINGMNCGSYLSKNSNNAAQNLGCSEPGGGYIAPYKDFLGWIPAANVVTTTANTSQTVTLEGDALALNGTTAKIIKICLAGSPCSGATARYYTVEARVMGLGANSQFDNGIPGEGIIIHEFKANRTPIQPNSCFFNNQSGWAVPIDSTPGDYNSNTCSFAPGTALYNAQFGVGTTYTNNADGVRVAVLSRNGSTFSVAVGPQQLPPPPAATLVSPNGAIGTTTPTYVWQAVASSTWYYLWVNDSMGTRITQWYTAAEAGCPNGTGNCSVTPGTGLALGAALWWVQTWNDSGYGPWSNAMALTVSGPPGAATLISPNGATSPTPTYVWQAVASATDYYLWVNDTQGNKVRTWYTRAQVGCSSGTGICSVTPGTTLVPGAAQWWIQTWNSNGYGPWSNAMTGNVTAPGAATLISPNSGGGGSMPTYRWQALASSTWYYLWVNDTQGNEIKTWYTAAQVGCPTGTGTCSIMPGTALAPGAVLWWIETWNPLGYGPWSNGMQFSVP